MLVTSGRTPKEGKSKNIMGGSKTGKLNMGMEMEKLKSVNNFYYLLHPSISRSNKSYISDTGASGH